MVQPVEMFACRLSDLNSIQSQAMLWPSYTQRERERQRGREGGGKVKVINLKLELLWRNTIFNISYRNKQGMQ